NRLVGEAMKTVTADAAGDEGARQCDGMRDRRLRGMKSRVEAGDLLQAGCTCKQRAHRSDVVRLMEGRQRDVALERGRDSGIDANGRVELYTTVHDAMAHREQAVPAKRRVQTLEQNVEGVRVRERRVRRP